MSSIGTILVPLDFSKHSDLALERAVALARALGAKLHLLHSYAFPAKGVMPYEMAVPTGVWDSIREATERQLEELRAELEGKGLQVSAEASALLPTDGIATSAREVGADLIVMGTRGNTGLKHVLLGSVAERTIRTAPCPVLTVKDKASAGEQPFGRIVVAVDFSEHSSHALDFAIELAKGFGAEIHLVHAYDIPVAGVTPYEIAIPDKWILEVRDAAARKLEKALQKVTGAGVKGKSHLTEVPAATAVAHLAEEVGADLIVMGTRGNTGVKHVLLGSVAERTLRLAQCSVLTLKAHDD